MQECKTSDRRVLKVKVLVLKVLKMVILRILILRILILKMVILKMVILKIPIRTPMHPTSQIRRVLRILFSLINP